MGSQAFSGRLLVVLLIGLQVVSPTSGAWAAGPVAAGPVSAGKGGCAAGFRGILAGIWQRFARGDSRRLQDGEYDTLADHKIGFYFPDGQVTDKGKQEFYRDFDLLLYNFERRHQTRLTNLKKVRAIWEETREDLLKAGLFKELKDKTLEQLLVESDRARAHNPPYRPLRERLLRPSNLLFPFRAIWGVTKYLGHAFRLGWEVQLTGVLLGGVIGLFAGPVGQTLLRIVNDHLGFLAVNEQDWLAKLDARLSSHVEKVVGEQDKLNSAYEKYRHHEISREEFDAIWEESVQTSLEYKQAMNSWISDNIKEGRNLYRDGAMLIPLQFIEAATAAHTEVLQYQSAIREFQYRLDDDQRGLRPLSPQDREETEKQLKKHQEELKSAEKKLGTVLAMFKVNEIMYPEFNRAEFMQRYPGQARLMNSYEKFMKGLAFDMYFEAYRVEMNQALADVGIHLRDKTKPEAPPPPTVE